MHSLQPNRTIPHPLEPALACLRRSGALPSPAALLESLSKSSGAECRLGLGVGKEALGGAGAAEES